MRTLVCVAASAGVFLTAGAAVAADTGRRAEPVRAISAQEHATFAAYRGPTVGHGYSADARRRADCLATYANYDPKSDRIRVAPGVTRRCES
jgi:hypothetical protein